MARECRLHVLLIVAVHAYARGGTLPQPCCARGMTHASEQTPAISPRLACSDPAHSICSPPWAALCAHCCSTAALAHWPPALHGRISALRTGLCCLRLPQLRHRRFAQRFIPATDSAGLPFDGLQHWTSQPHFNGLSFTGASPAIRRPFFLDFARLLLHTSLVIKRRSDTKTMASYRHDAAEALFYPPRGMIPPKRNAM